MVQISPLISILPVISQFTPSDSTSKGLVVRQTLEPNYFPPACQSFCQVVNTVTDCGDDLNCMCTNSLGSQLEQCVNCIVNVEPAVESEAQSTISSWNEACNWNLSLSGGSSSGGTTSGTTGGTSPATTTGASSGGNSLATTTGASSGGTSPATMTGASSGGSSTPNPSGSNSAVGLQTGSIAVCIAAALVGAFMSL